MKRSSVPLTILRSSTLFLGAWFITSGKAISEINADKNIAITVSTNGDPLSECYHATEGESRIAIAKCLQDELDAAEKGLIITYSKVMEGIKSTHSAGADAALKSLQLSQKAFESFRDAECQRVDDAAFGGSGGSDFKQACKVRLTRWRIDELRNN